MTAAGPCSAAPADLVVTGCTVLVHERHERHEGDEGYDGYGDPERIGFRQDAALVVRAGVIDAVTTAAAVREVPAVTRIEAHGQVALPGLINCHTHAPMVALRGLAEDLPIDEWFNDVVWPVEANLGERDVELGARLACALGAAYFSSQGPQGREDSLEFALRQRGAADGRITTALAPHAPYTVTDADLRATAELAREHGLPVHIHAAENRDQTATSIARYGLTPIEILDRTGLLGTDLLIAHGTGIVDRDLPLLERTGGRTAVATAPRGYLKFAWPTTTPVRALRAAGVPVGLATDGAASNNSLDVWEAMALTSLTQKSAEGDPRRLTSRQALHHATVQSARAVGLGEQVGTLAPGRRADFVLVDLTGPHTQPVHDLAATLVHSVRAADVRTTVVDGRVLMRDREILTLDVGEVVRELTDRLPALTARDHGRRIQEYDT
jgi:5-methylthioadenosine/S-adenosylhomocysteine deaminase